MRKKKRSVIQVWATTVQTTTNRIIAEYNTAIFLHCNFHTLPCTCTTKFITFHSRPTTLSLTLLHLPVYKRSSSTFSFSFSCFFPFFFNSASACRGSEHNRKFKQLIHNTRQCYFQAKIPPPPLPQLQEQTKCWMVLVLGALSFTGGGRRKLGRVKCKALQRCETRILHKLSLTLLNEWLTTLLNEWLVTILNESANSLIPSS